LNKIEIVESNDGFDSYGERFKFLFLLKNAQFYKLLGQPALVPALYGKNEPHLQNRKLDIHDNSREKEFFTTLEGVKYAAFLKWLVLSVDRASYSLRYSFKTGATQQGSSISFSAALFHNGKMLDSVSRQFLESQLLATEPQIAQELVGMVFQCVNRQ